MQQFKIESLALTHQLSVLIALLALCGIAAGTNNFYMDLNGNYKYSFTTDDGSIHSEQQGNQQNEVSGHYMYYDKEGVPFMVRYHAGVNGFQPEIINMADTSANARMKIKATTNSILHPPLAKTTKPSSLNFVENAIKCMQTQPLQISYNSMNTHVRTHPPAPATNKAARRDEQLLGYQTPASRTAKQYEEPPTPYSFSYDSDNSARSESGDTHGNVVGKYSYNDENGYHDLSYKAGDNTGFVVIGGNLAKPNAAKTKQDIQADARTFTTHSSYPDESQRSSDTKTWSTNAQSRSLRKFKHFLHS